MSQSHEEEMQQYQEFFDNVHNRIKRGYVADQEGRLVGRTFSEYVEGVRQDVEKFYQEDFLQDENAKAIFGDDVPLVAQGFSELVIDMTLVRVENPGIANADIRGECIKNQLESQGNIPSHTIEAIILADKMTGKQNIKDYVQDLSDGEFDQETCFEGITKLEEFLKQSEIQHDVAEKILFHNSILSTLGMIVVVGHADEKLDVRETLTQKGIEENQISEVENNIESATEWLSEATIKILEGETSGRVKDVREAFKATVVPYLTDNGLDEYQAGRVFNNNIVKEADRRALQGANLIAVSVQSDLDKMESKQSSADTLKM